MEKTTRKTDALLAAGVLLAALLGCGVGSTALPTPTTAVISECFFSAAATVWEDTNGDGIRNGDEPLLPNIPVNTYHTGREEPLYEGSSGPDGTGSFGAISTVCDWESYSVRVLVPEGYTPTTATEFTFTQVGDRGTALFGLQPDGGN